MSDDVGTTAASVIPKGGMLPRLALEDWESTRDTVHLWAQIIGKIKLAHTPLKNQWWNVPLYLDARGLTTRVLRHGERSFRVDLDFVVHRLELVTDAAGPSGFELVDGLTVAAFYERLVGLLAEAGIEVRIRPEPFGVPMTTPFPDDTEHASYDAAAVERYWRALEWTYWVLEGFAGWFSGKASPVQLYWHSFDLAYTRFSGRDAPTDPGADSVNREAYDQEVISFGFWPGDRNTRFPAFYSYTAPEPEGLTKRRLEPGAARWTAANGGHLAVLPYEEVRASEDPQRDLLGFLESAYQAGAAAAKWPLDHFRSNWCPRPGELVVLSGH
jgi:Family of unknown function (DUF5996)